MVLMDILRGWPYTSHSAAEQESLAQSSPTSDVMPGKPNHTCIFALPARRRQFVHLPYRCATRCHEPLVRGCACRSSKGQPTRPLASSTSPTKEDAYVSPREWPCNWTDGERELSGLASPRPHCRPPLAFSATSDTRATTAARSTVLTYGGRLQS